MMCTESEGVVPPFEQALPVPQFTEALAALFSSRAGVAAATDADLRELRACRRRKLWEIPSAYHCAIVGTCLPMAALRRLARRAGIEQWQRASDYELHHVAVNTTCERNALSQLLHKELETRFALAVRRFAQARTEEHISALWNEAIGRGEIAGALWAAMSHPHATESVRESISQDVHMLSHQAGAASRADLRRLTELQRENKTLRQALERQREKFSEKLAAKEQAIVSLGARAAAAVSFQQRLQEAEKELRVLEEGGALARARELLDAQSLRAQRAEARATRCERKLTEYVERVHQLEQALDQSKPRRGAERQEDRGSRAPAGYCHEREQTRTATDPDLSGRRVLCVGGRSSLIDHYRALVEQRHGRFLHHDGGLEDNFARLQSLLASTDAVVCAARHISHGAYYVVKRFCKKHRKPCILLKNDGASSFLKGVRALTGMPTEAGMGDTVLVAARSGLSAVGM